MNYLMIKRILDFLISGLALLLLLPLLVVVAALIRLESEGNPLFFQDRIGKGGEVFCIIKFRSMVKDASKLGSWSTSQDDPRITRMGQFIRRTSIDELPQLWNVFVGDMSLIGPRPETPHQEMLYNPVNWRIRHRIRPGITGLAQVNGRSVLTPESRLHYDLEYALSPSLRQDIKILIATIIQVLRRTGVN